MCAQLTSEAPATPTIIETNSTQNLEIKLFFPSPPAHPADNMVGPGRGPLLLNRSSSEGWKEAKLHDLSG